MKATPAQLKFLRTLAMRTGQSFTPPTSSAAAHREIERLLSLDKTPGGQRQREREQIVRDLHEQRGDSTRVRGDETTGYGSSARWRRR